MGGGSSVSVLASAWRKFSNSRSSFFSDKLWKLFSRGVKRVGEGGNDCKNLKYPRISNFHLSFLKVSFLIISNL